MRYVRFATLSAVFAAAALLVSCGEGEASYPVRTYTLGEHIALGHINYQVFETQWLTQIGEPPAQRIPKQRFFLVRMSATSNASADVMVPNFTLEDDSGNIYPELSDSEGVAQYIGYLRTLKPNDSAQGNALFDCPPRHYKLKIHDETGEKTAYVDIPLTFVSETPEVPEVGGREKKK